jgi:hypothetical protein
MIGLVTCACAHSTLADSSSTTAPAPATAKVAVAATPAPAATTSPSLKNRSLAYLSASFISTAEASDTRPEMGNTGNNSNLVAPKKSFSPAQEAMMQNLSKMINVSNGGVWLALKLPLSIR